MYVIGTAGHVDHGKSALVKALTGVDPDRLQEEKERGLTIELGFAPLDLPGGARVSIVDVPGHERFIKTMLAGVGGIDLGLLAIAADEGVMPQTREHLAILDLLGVEHGVVALTKTDLVDAEWLAAAKAEAAAAIAGTTLAGAPVVACSALTGEGLEALVAAVEGELAKVPRKLARGRARLPIDRAFTMAGFGTVVTGTLLDGALRAGQEVEIVPGGRTARVRGLQNHGASVDEALPGTRTAVNLSGVAAEDLRRGMVLALPGAVHATTCVDVLLRAVPYLSREVRHNLRVTFHTGAAEAAGRLLLLDADSLRAGESAWAQVRLDEPVAALPGDGFIVRDPNDTLGGGRIVATDAPRHRRHHAATIAALETLARATTLDAAIGAIRAASEAASEVESRAMAALAEYHQRWPLRPGMPREELRNRLGLAARGFDGVVASLVEQGLLRDEGGVIADRSHTPQPTADERAAADTYLAILRAKPFSPPTDGRPPEELVAYLVQAGEAVAAGDCVFEAAAYGEAVRRITGHLQDHRTVTLAQVRDLLGTSRRYAQALLEHLDARQLTRRVGDERVLR
jgi:selenocysteine-specific elongation factor